MKFLQRWQSLIIACLLSVGFATAGALVTNLDTWYFNLNQPSWKPPDAAFGLIWSLIFSLCAAAGWLSWNSAQLQTRKYLYLCLYLINGVLNLAWSLWECGLLGLSIVALIYFQWKDSKWASLLVVPYLIWVCIAATLNWQTVVLNGF